MMHRGNGGSDKAMGGDRYPQGGHSAPVSSGASQLLQAAGVYGCSRQIRRHRTLQAGSPTRHLGSAGTGRIFQMRKEVGRMFLESKENKLKKTLH